MTSKKPTHRFEYPVKISVDEEGYHLVTFPDLPFGATDGRSREEALSEASECLDAVLATLIGGREDIPRPSPARGRPLVSPSALMTAKAALYLVMRETGTTNVALARALKCDEKEVRRLLSPQHRSRMDRLEKALAVLGKRLVMETRDAA